MNNDIKIVKELNEMKDSEQIKHFREKCKELDWEVFFSLKLRTDRKKIKDIRNFHVCINNSYIKQIQRIEYVDKIGREVKNWSIWTAKERINGQYGDIMAIMIKHLNGA
jgi:hypothetical protein